MPTIIGTAVLEIATDTDLMDAGFKDVEKSLRDSGMRAGESFADAVEREVRESSHKLQSAAADAALGITHELDDAAKDSARSFDQAEQSIDGSLKGIGEAAEESGEKVRRSNEEIGESFEKTREGFDVGEQRAMGFRDTLTGVQDSMAGTAALAKGDLFNGLFLVGAGVGDLASGFANFLVPALKAAVIRIGAARLALIGLGAAAAIGAVGILAFALMDAGDAAEDTGDDIMQLQKDVKTLVETGSVVGELKRNFDVGAVGVENFTRSVRTLQIDFNNMTQSDVDFISSLDDMQGTIDESRSNFGSLDAALADYINQGGSAAVATKALGDAYGTQNVQLAIANGLLPEFSKATLDAADQQTAMGGATEQATIETERQIAAMDRFTSQLKAQTDPVFAFINSQTRLKSAQEDVSKALAESGRGSDEYKGAVERLAEAELRSIDATTAMAGASEETIIPVLQQLKRDGQLSESSFKAFEKALKDAKKQADKLDGTRIKVYRDEYRRIFEEQFSGGNSGASFSTFHEGGVVPGHRGDEVLALLKAGELVQTEAQWRNQATNNNAVSFGPGSIVINVNGGDMHSAREAGGMAADEFLRRLGQAVAVS